MATATFTSKVGSVLKDAPPNSININKLLNTVLALTTKGSLAQVDNLFTIILTTLCAPPSRASIALPKATMLRSRLDLVSPQRPTSHPKAKHSPPTPANSGPPTPPPSPHQLHQCPALAWVPYNPLLTTETAAPPAPPVEAPAPMLQAPNDPLPRALTPTPPIQASRLLDLLNSTQADLQLASPSNPGLTSPPTHGHLPYFISAPRGPSASMPGHLIITMS
jgi:hypothetical protein